MGLFHTWLQGNTRPQSNFLIQPKHCKSICDLFGLPVTGCEWEGDSSSIHCKFCSRKLFGKFGKEGIRIMNKNKWHNGPLQEKYSFGPIRHLNLVQFTVPTVLMQGLRFFLYDYVTYLYALYTSLFILCVFEICHIFRELADIESKVRNVSHWKASFDT